jgi:hypothetical protein
MNNPVHILRYGTVAEKAQMEKAISTYDYLIINGNSAAFVSRAIAKFVVEKFFNDKKKGFIIDPITYAFQQNIHLLKNKSRSGESILKKSIKKLIEKYQYPAEKIEADVPIQPSDFSENKKLLEDFCLRVLKFQYSIIDEYINNNDLGKYLQYATGNMNYVLQQFHPKILIAPYFYLNPKDSLFESWLGLNISFLNEALIQAKDHFQGKAVFGQIVINKDVLLNDISINKIISAYTKCPCNGFTIWVDGFDEHEESIEMLSGFMTFLSGFKGKPIFNMYGSFFSILLTHPSIQLLDGVSHGMEYGESREVYPVGGGIPVSKYYYMPLHQRKDFTKAFYLLEHEKILDTSIPDWGTCDRYYHEICYCEQCRKIMENEMQNFVKFESDRFYEMKSRNGIIRRKMASAETKENCLFHYLLCKKIEFLMMRNRGIDEILTSLIEEKEKYINSAMVKQGELDYLDNWYKAISDYVSNIKDNRYVKK